MADQDRVIEADGLRCSYGDFEAVRGVTFEVGRGELFALLGTNGAGKTTTMETLEGHRPPTAGQARVLGMHPYRQRTKVRRHTGVMLQESGFMGDLTVYETLRMWGRLTSRRTDPAGALELLDLSHRRDVRVSQLSGGEKRRLDMAMATLGDPEILFLDEPTTGLDPESRQRVWEIIRGFVDDGATVVLTTHYLEEAEALADKLAIMHEGELAVTGTLGELLAAYPARIAFDFPEDLDWGDVPSVVGEVDRNALAGNRFECRTSSLQEDLKAVLEWAEQRALQLGHLRAQHASLDEIFAAVAHGPSQGQAQTPPAAAASAQRGGRP